jgi:hypothetical protein
MNDYEGGGMVYLWGLPEGKLISAHPIMDQDAFHLSANGETLAALNGNGDGAKIEITNVGSWRKQSSRVK